MEFRQIIIVFFMSLLHLVLAGMLLDDLGRRKRILGGNKIPWAVAILLLVFVGPLVYILCHPAIFYGKDTD